MTRSDGMHDRVAVVTGASRGIGAALAMKLAASGAIVVCVARSTSARPGSAPGTLDDTVAVISAAGGTAHAVAADLRDAAAVRAAVQAAVDITGRLDILVNNAAAAVPADWSSDRKRFDLLLDVNVWAPMVATQAAFEHLRARGDGRVLNVSSIAATHAIEPLQIYGLSKVALEHLTVSTAGSVAASGVAINCLRVDMPVASEGAMHWNRFGDGDGWVAPTTAAEAMMTILRWPVHATGCVVDLSSLAEVDGGVRRAGRAEARHGATEIFH